MALMPYLAELIIREHRFRPLPPVVHTVGRLAVELDFKRGAELFVKCCVERAEVEVEIDHETWESAPSGKTWY